MLTTAAEGTTTTLIGNINTQYQNNRSAPKQGQLFLEYSDIEVLAIAKSWFFLEYQDNEMFLREGFTKKSSCSFRFCPNYFRNDSLSKILLK